MIIKSYNNNLLRNGNVAIRNEIQEKLATNYLHFFIIICHKYILFRLNKHVYLIEQSRLFELARIYLFAINKSRWFLVVLNLFLGGYIFYYYMFTSPNTIDNPIICSKINLKKLIIKLSLCRLI